MPQLARNIAWFTFPGSCPACLAPRVDERWVDPNTRDEYDAYVEHGPECWVYFEQAYNRLELVAHLLAVTKEKQRRKGRHHMDDDTLRGTPIPEEWTKNSGATRRPLEVGMEIRLPNGNIFPVLSVNRAGATVRGNSRMVTVRGRTFPTTGPPVQIALYAEVEYRKQRARMVLDEDGESVVDYKMDGAVNDRQGDTQMAKNESKVVGQPVGGAKAPKAAKTPATPRLAGTVKAKEKKPAAELPCLCGCGGTTAKFFVPGHDARFKGWLIKIASGKLKAEEVLSKDAIKALGPWNKTPDGGLAPSKTYHVLRG